MFWISFHVVSIYIGELLHYRNPTSFLGTKKPCTAEAPEFFILGISLAFGCATADWSHICQQDGRERLYLVTCQCIKLRDSMFLLLLTTITLETKPTNAAAYLP